MLKKEIPEKTEVPHTLPNPEDQILNWSGQHRKENLILAPYMISNTQQESVKD